MSIDSQEADRNNWKLKSTVPRSLQTFFLPVTYALKLKPKMMSIFSLRKSRRLIVRMKISNELI